MIGRRALSGLIADSRLTDAARLLGIHLAMLGEGEHELPYDQLATLLHGCPNRNTVGGHIRKLEAFGYIERTSEGGRGHSPRFRWIGLAPNEACANATYSTNARALTATDDVADADVTTPPVIPLPPALHPDAEAAIERHGEKLRGCRDSLRDYLRLRVPPERQYGYVQAVATWLDGFGFNWSSGRHQGMPLPRGERPPLLAAALNELAATNEGKRVHDAGDPANLKTKLGILLNPREHNVRHHAGTGTDGRHRGAAAGVRSEAGATDRGARPRIPID